jgi:hypothetical protein
MTPRMETARQVLQLKYRLKLSAAGSRSGRFIDK